jgi:hypothetical protein
MMTSSIGRVVFQGERRLNIAYGTQVACQVVRYDEREIVQRYAPVLASAQAASADWSG